LYSWYIVCSKFIAFFSHSKNVCFRLFTFGCYFLFSSFFLPLHLLFVCHFGSIVEVLYTGPWWPRPCLVSPAWLIRVYLNLVKCAASWLSGPLPLKWTWLDKPETARDPMRQSPRSRLSIESNCLSDSWFKNNNGPTILPLIICVWLDLIRRSCLHMFPVKFRFCRVGWLNFEEGEEIFYAQGVHYIEHHSSWSNNRIMFELKYKPNTVQSKSVIFQSI